MLGSWWKSLWTAPKPSVLIQRYLDGEMDSRAIDELFDGWVTFGENEGQWFDRFSELSDKYVPGSPTFRGLYTEEAKAALQKMANELRIQNL